MSSAYSPSTPLLKHDSTFLRGGFSESFLLHELSSPVFTSLLLDVAFLKRKIWSRSISKLFRLNWLCICRIIQQSLFYESVPSRSICWRRRESWLLIPESPVNTRFSLTGLKAVNCLIGGKTWLAQLSLVSNFPYHLWLHLPRYPKSSLTSDIDEWTSHQ